MGFQWSHEDRSIGDGFLRIAREQITRARTVATDSTQPPAKRVHEARRRAKKLRALLRLVRPDFSHYAAENGHVRDAARGLSSARDTQVIEETLIALLEWAGRKPPPRTAPHTRATGEEAHLGEFASRMDEMLTRSERWKTGRIDTETLAQGLTATYRKGAEAMQLVAAHPSDEGFHEWRKHTKYFWNQIGLLEPSARNILPSVQKCAGDLAEVLGAHHDIAVLCDVIAAGGQLGEIDSDFVLDAAKRRQEELEAEIWALGRQVYAETPKALCARFLSYLDGWVAREAAE